MKPAKNEIKEVTLNTTDKLFLFLDIDECKRDNGDCEHKCHNYEGGYWCSCNDGYKLKDDDHGCEGNRIEALMTGVKNWSSRQNK